MQMHDANANANASDFCLEFATVFMTDEFCFDMVFSLASAYPDGFGRWAIMLGNWLRVTKEQFKLTREAALEDFQEIRDKEVRNAPRLFLTHEHLRSKMDSTEHPLLVVCNHSAQCHHLVSPFSVTM